MNVYHTWVKHRGEVLETKKVGPKKLNKIVQFFTKLKKQDGQDYELNSFFIFNVNFDRQMSP